jgi:hypothetical protein
MITNVLRGRATSDAVDENRFTVYSPEWFFARYTNLMVTDLNAAMPIKHGLNQADALAFVDEKTGWNGVLSELKFEWAVAAHRALHWNYSQIAKVYNFSPVTVDILMLFKKEFGDEEVADIIDTKIRQLNYFRGYPEATGELGEVVEATVKAMTASHASVLFHNILYSAVLDRSVQLKANSQFLSKLILSKNTSDAVVRSYSTG